LNQSASATIVLPGFDLWKTQPGSVATFAAAPIPADFFAPGSDPFMGFAPLQGVPSGPGLADTIVRRTGTLPDMTPGTIPIEIVALSLVSSQPIIVTGSGGPTMWNLEVILPPMTTQSPGNMNVVHTDPGGGTFSANLPVQARFTFTEVSNPTNTKTIMPDPIESFFFPPATPWSHNPDPMDAHDLSFPAGNFFAGVDPVLNLPALVNVTSTRLNLNLLPACVPEVRAWLMLGAVAIGIGGISLARRMRGGLALRV
jgi:hypothetical protein